MSLSGETPLLRFRWRFILRESRKKSVNSDLIDWKSVALHALWIIGLSFNVAAFSFHHWLARTNGRRLRDQLASPSWGIASSFGLMLFCLSFTIRGDGVIESMLWALLFLAFLWRLVFLMTSFRI